MLKIFKKKERSPSHRDKPGTQVTSESPQPGNPLGRIRTSVHNPRYIFMGGRKKDSATDEIKVRKEGGLLPVLSVM